MNIFVTAVYLEHPNLFLNNFYGSMDASKSSLLEITVLLIFLTFIL
jgi:hypothetical protein